MGQLRQKDTVIEFCLLELAELNAGYSDQLSTAPCLQWWESHSLADGMAL